MSILFGHPTGNPNSHHAALAHFERDRLEAFVVPWMPSKATLHVLELLPVLQSQARRLSRRRFEALAGAPVIQGRYGEFKRLWTRLCTAGDERLAYEANDWLMKTMASECRRPNVTAVHSYEDCSLWQFEEAKRLGKACIYDMPIGYYPAWERTQAELARVYADWLPAGGLPSSRWVRPEQKRREMELADIVLAPSEFVRQTIEAFVPKQTVVAPYGIDCDYWQPAPTARNGPLVFLAAGQLALRKGTPVLLEAWRRAGIGDAILRLIGTWQLADGKRRELPDGCEHIGPVSKDELLRQYHSADVFVLPTFFEGRALVCGEAMACGLPLITTPASGCADLIGPSCGCCNDPWDVDALVGSLRWFSGHRDQLPAMRIAARQRAEQCSWAGYRQKVAAAVTPFC